MTLIDTSAWIEFLRRSGAPDVKSRVATYLDVGAAAICGPVEFELLAGARPSEIVDIRTAAELSTRLEFPTACWRRAADLERSLRGRDVTVPRDDLFVAAAALEHGVPIYARDAHLDLMRSAGGCD